MGNFDPNTKVLVVTSVRDNAKAIVVALKNLDLTNVTIKESGLQALQSLTQDPWDLVVCDQEMKQIDGWMFVKEFKLSEKVPNVPAILVGREGSPADEATLQSYGISKYLKMPVASSQLDFLIHSTLSLAKTSGTIENKYTQAKDSLINKRSEEAVELYSELQTLTDGSIRSNSGLAQAYVQNEELEKAQPLLDKIAKSKDNNPSSMMLTARIHIKKGSYPDAIEIIRDLLDAFGNEFYYSRCVELLMEDSDPKTSLPFTLQARELSYDAKVFYLCMTRNHLKDGDYADALKEIDLCEEKFGESAELNNWKGVCFRKVGQYNDAVDAYEKALRLNPENHKVYFNIALCLVELGSISQAIQHLESCCKLKPDFTRAADKLAELKGRQAS